MTLAADTQASTRSRGLLDDLARVLRAHLPRPRRADPTEQTTSTEDDAVVRALCHDMRTPLASLEAVLGSLDRAPAQRAELLELARAQTAHLSSMLRTADASGGAVRRSRATRRLGDVVLSAVSSSGLPRSQLTLELREDAEDVAVGDARVQRILINLLENAHRHGGGAPVRLLVIRRIGWVELALSQGGVPADRIVQHLGTTRPPVDLTGLGLWSVQQQTRELGGRLLWTDRDGEFTFTVQLPDR
ncbi:sensor histidine kinase [Blastococcus saxobsidens]|uniref:histidine kinase n=1 Tax=Blastococcus saxobsidens (strain DD2) TaxID=1146883 RepID=H6RL46_BLASD|nr:HAMP domain-containing sensor histidine kinase [Blastococcus saxobsidens]CCG01176.1 Two component signal transduction histidine kinase [Blastococcus saxobsidens DD2]